ncbi:MAG: acetamidase/formamidase family protein [Gammaproteobacteria bacterium]
MMRIGCKRFGMAGSGRAVVLASLFVASSLCWGAPGRDPVFTGRWNIVVEHGAESVAMELELTRNGEKYTGISKSLDVGMGLSYEGSVQGRQLHLISSAVRYAKVVAAPKSVGTVDVKLVDGRLVGKGTLYGTAVTWKGERPDEKSHASRTYDYVPDRYITTLSGRNEPVLHIQPGDSVRTTTVDANGLDHDRQWRSIPGNPHTGPFYIEGAMPGDTLVVHLTRVRINQAQAEMFCGGLSSNALPSGGGLTQSDAECDWIWALDAGGNIARPRTPSSRLKNLRVPMRPMVGSIGVAPGSNEAFSAADLRMHGGNLDYNRIVEGVTLYFPVFRVGALFSLGDGHAAQGDGEITGQGLETSLSVEFKVDLIKGKAPRFPWAEDGEYVMFSGIGNSMNEALQASTAGLVEWLKDRYQLGTGDLAMILGTSIQYDVAEIVDPRPHVVAKLRKDLLAQIQ